jgi:hypothetical protein
VRLPAQPVGGGLFDLSDQALREPLDLGVGQGAPLGLKHDGDGERLFAFSEAGSLVDIEEADLGDELAVDTAGGARNRGSAGSSRSTTKAPARPG